MMPVMASSSRQFLQATDGCIKQQVAEQQQQQQQQQQAVTPPAWRQV
jgi:hypothetical protein